MASTSVKQTDIPIPYHCSISKVVCYLMVRILVCANQCFYVCMNSFDSLINRYILKVNRTLFLGFCTFMFCCGIIIITDDNARNCVYILHGCFRLCDWLSLYLGPWINLLSA